MKYLSVMVWTGIVLLGLSSHANAKSSLIKSIFKYECRNASIFQCVVEVSDGEPYLKIKFDKLPDEDSESTYKARLLMARFLSAGGKYIELYDLDTGKKRDCSRFKGRIDIDCREWGPQ